MHEDTPARRKARGAFFTPPKLAQYLANWAIRTPEDSVLEPSCGDAEFLLAAGRRTRDLGGGLFAGCSLDGVELDAQSALTATQRLTNEGLSVKVSVGDFFDRDPGDRSDGLYDAVIGNPPYIRYHAFAGAGRVKGQKAALKAGVRINGLASAWAPFVVHASRFVSPNGRLGLVLPAELLTVGYAAEIRRFLLERFAEVRLVMFEQLVFPGVQEEVVLLLAEGTGGAPHFQLYQARNLDELQDLHAAQWTAFQPDHAGTWSGALLPTSDMEVYSSIVEGDDFSPLTQWGNPYLGIVTGANSFFTLSADDAKLYCIPDDELLRISPPGSRHLRGLTFSERSWTELSDEGRRVYLLYPRTRPSAAATRYIESGEAAHTNNGYKCRNRSPWWRVPLVDVPDLLLTYMDKDRPRLATNRAQAHILNSLYGVRLHSGLKRIGKDLLPIAALNSVTLLGAEVVGRAFGGGMLKLEPKEAGRLPLPAVELLVQYSNELRVLQPHLSIDLRQGNLNAAVDKVDRVLLTQGLGLTHQQLVTVRRARATLFGRRETRSGGNGGG